MRQVRLHFLFVKNGNPINDFSATGLNTRPTSTNNYANKLTLGSSASAIEAIDDFFWQSSATAGAWLGDIRCYTRMPANTVSKQFSAGGMRSTLSGGGGLAYTTTTGRAVFPAVCLAYAGNISTMGLTIQAAFTGQYQRCIILLMMAGKIDIITRNCIIR